MKSLRDELLAACLLFVNEIEHFERVTPDATLAEREAHQLDLSGVINVLVLQLRLNAATLRSPGRCPTCQEWSRDLVVRRKTRSIETVFGTVQVPYRRVTCRSCRQDWVLSDALGGVPSYGRMSAGLTQWVVDVGTLLPFAPASRLLETLTGVSVSGETIRRHTEAAGTALDRETAVAAAQAVAEQESPGPIAVPSGDLVVEMDGVMVRYRDGFHEVRVGAVGGWASGRLREQSYLALRGTVAAFQERLAAESARRGAWDIIGWTGPVTGRGLAELRPVVVLGDGAPWIWNLASESFGTRTEIVDYYHATEHLGTVATAVFGQDAEWAKTWAAEQRLRLLTQGADPILKALTAFHGLTAEQQEVVRRERGYFSKNRERMQYPTFQAQGLPIGSGAVEGACKSVVQARLKRSGMRWSEPGAQALLALCARNATDLAKQQAA